MLPVRTVFCPTDFSEQLAPAFELACALARDYGAAFVIAHGSPTPIPSATDGIVVAPPFRMDGRRAAKARLEAIHPSDPAICFSYQFTVGDAGLEIVVADSHHFCGFGSLIAKYPIGMFGHASP